MSSLPQSLRERAPRNRTLTVSETEAENLRTSLTYDIRQDRDAINQIVCGDAFEVLGSLSATRKFDLLFADPPYNLTKSFGKEKFSQLSLGAYAEWLDSWLTLCRTRLKPTASVYICGDWRSSAVIQTVGSSHFRLRNRITWEREKGRGAQTNWKNTAEDIWFFTVSDEYIFNVASVKQRCRVLAPYRDNGKPKDWTEDKGGNYRDTHPSNIWTDISIPFWSMPENTDHPTQKPEKLMAKIILASTNPGDLILDPFAGAGTTAVTAKKLDRNFVAIESDENYCLLAQKRLMIADKDNTIQGFADGVFWDRNTSPQRS